ncbi:MAG: DUF1566 domain-containing protein [Deltaproteobacteria bacterium]|nr:DUF1566 domain-containing protein [Deltaproteobacteria bacterium]
MKKTIWGWFLYCFVPWAFSVYAFAGPLPETGQSRRNAIISETAGASPDLLLLGKNTDHTPPSYTKLSSTGNPLPDSAASWAMVKDNVTGLIWEVKRNMDGISNYDDPNDADNTYTWYDSNPNTNGGYAGTPGNGANTEAFIKAMNKTHFGGYSDWRLPSIKELANLVDSANSNPSINTKFFPDTAASWYWSSSTSANYTHLAWGVGFRHGYDSYNHKYFHGYVRAARGGQNVTTTFLKGGVNPIDYPNESAQEHPRTGFMMSLE